MTPVGPGGRPFARWRALLTVLALVALGMAVAVLLSERAPGAIGDVSVRLSDRLDRHAPDAGEDARRAVARTGVSEPDTLAHIGLWSAATLLVGLATWSWRSLIALVGMLLIASTGLELVQEHVAPTRVTEWRDVGANAVGIGLGLVVVVAISSVTGVPTRLRRWSYRRLRARNRSTPPPRHV